MWPPLVRISGRPLLPASRNRQHHPNLPAGRKDDRLPRSQEERGEIEVGMASIVERTTKKGERRLYVTFRAIERATGTTKKIWLLEPTGLLKEAKATKADVEVGLRSSGGKWPLSAAPSPVEQ